MSDTKLINNISDELTSNKLNALYGNLDFEYRVDIPLGEGNFDSFFEKFKQYIASDKNDSSSLSKAYKIIGELLDESRAVNHTSLFLEVIEEGLKSKQNSADSLIKASFALEQIAKADTKNIINVLKLYKKILQSDKINDDVFRYVYWHLCDISEKNPAFCAEIFTVLADGLSTGKISKNLDTGRRNFLYETSFTLKHNPELIDDFLKEITNKLQSEENSSVSLSFSYDALRRIVALKPEKAPEILQILKVGLQQAKNDDDSLNDAYWALGNILDAKPELSSEILEIVKIGLKHEKDYMEGACNLLEKIVKVNPQLTFEAWNTAKNYDVYNSKFAEQISLQEHSVIPKLLHISQENWDNFAEIYEEYACNYQKLKLNSIDDIVYNVGEENILNAKNMSLEKDDSPKVIMDSIRNKILNTPYTDYKEKIFWLTKNANKFPNLVNDCIEYEKKFDGMLFVEMCIKNIENPEKENIGSLLNRLEAKDAKTFDDFQDAQDFVARRDMCMRATGGDKQLSYDMAEAGVSDFRTAKRVNDLFITLNECPETYGSSYNEYYPKDLLPIAKSNVMQDWMYPVMMDAIRNEVLSTSEGRMPSERTLFDCCKAWKICPTMPQRLAKFVGTHSLRGRMLAGAIFDKMCEEGKTTPQEWRDNKVLHEKFYEELARAEKMPREKAFRQYISNTPINRKRLVGMGMEEKGIENTPENFKQLYRKARDQGIFEKMLAKPEEVRTTFSSRLLVETARRHFDKQK